MNRRPGQLSALLTAGLARRKLAPAVKPRVLLTFDDGPCEDVTAGVLERLEAAAARAVFFVIGQRAAENPDLLRQIKAAGHQVGNHSHSHPPGRWPAWGPYLDDLRQCNRILDETLGQPATLFRAPYGYLHPASVLGSRKLAMHHMLWSLDSLDWTCRNAEDARAAAEEVLNEVRDGDIILLHDYATCTWDLLDVLLPGLQAKGFDLESGLGELI